MRRKIARAVEGCWYSLWKVRPGSCSKYSNDRLVEAAILPVRSGFPPFYVYYDTFMSLSPIREAEYKLKLDEEKIAVLFASFLSNIAADSVVVGRAFLHDSPAPMRFC